MVVSIKILKEFTDDEDEDQDDEYIDIVCKDLDINCERKIYVMSYNIVYVVKRFLMIILILVCQNYPIMVILIFMAISFQHLIWLYTQMPFSDKFQNYHELINELFVYLFYLTTLTFLREDITQDNQYWNGWILITIILLSMLFNLSIITIRIIIEVIAFVKSIYKRIQSRN